MIAATPPRRPRLVLRVGFIGHRPDKLDSSTGALSTEIDRVLAVMEEEIKSLQLHRPERYLETPAQIRILSSVADGADRLGARAALAHECALACILPFARQEYERDFRSSDSIQEFRSLLESAESVLELDGNPDARTEAYQEAGRLIVRHSDVVIAVWDGAPAAGPGGTAQIVENALAIGTPVVWIQPSRPTESSVLSSGFLADTNARPLETIASHLERILFPPASTPNPVADAYYRAPSKGSGFGIFRRFHALASLGHRHSSSHSAPPTPPTDQIAREYAWADQLADKFGVYYRDSFVANYLLGAFAVTAALVGQLSQWATAVELVLIIAILTITRRARRRHWHEQWLGYRLIGEQFRQLRFLCPIAGAPMPIRGGTHVAGVEGDAQWGAWLLHARIRELPLLNRRIDREYLLEYQARLAGVIDEQRRFHETRASSSGHVNHRLHQAGAVFFGATAVICVAHLWAPHAIWAERGQVHAWPWILSALPAVLPAFGAAVAGIDNHAEFSRVAQRSRATAQRLAALGDQLAAVKDPRFKSLSRAADRAAELMSADLLDWQVISWGRPVTLPA